MSQSNQGKSLKGKDLITVGIFSAIYFATGQLTVVILVSFVTSCLLAGLSRLALNYDTFRGSLMLRTIMGKCLRGITEFLQNPT